jgi:hypothetical protein
MENLNSVVKRDFAERRLRQGKDLWKEAEGGLVTF